MLSLFQSNFVFLCSLFDLLCIISMSKKGFNCISKGIPMLPLLPQVTFETISFHPLAWAIFHTFTQIILSSNHILFTYITYLISFASCQCLKKGFYYILQKAVLLPPSLPDERQEGLLLPFILLSGVLNLDSH